MTGHIKHINHSWQPIRWSWKSHVDDVLLAAVALAALPQQTFTGEPFGVDCRIDWTVKFDDSASLVVEKTFGKIRVGYKSGPLVEDLPQALAAYSHNPSLAKKIARMLEVGAEMMSSVDDVRYQIGVLWATDEPIHGCTPNVVRYTAVDDRHRKTVIVPVAKYTFKEWPPKRELDLSGLNSSESVTVIDPRDFNFDLRGLPHDHSQTILLSAGAASVHVSSEDVKYAETQKIYQDVNVYLNQFIRRGEEPDFDGDRAMEFIRSRDKDHPDLRPVMELCKSLSSLNDAIVDMAEASIRHQFPVVWDLFEGMVATISIDSFVRDIKFVNKAFSTANFRKWDNA